MKRVDILNRHRIRFVFEQPNNPLLIMRLGELPVLPQHYWKNRDFKATTFEPPLGSGPYRITQVQPGRQVVFERVRDWWGEAASQPGQVQLQPRRGRVLPRQRGGVRSVQGR